MSARSIIRAARKEMRPVLRELVKQGWTLKLTGKNHIKALPPDSGKLAVFLPLTPSSSNICQQILPRLRKAGYKESA